MEGWKKWYIWIVAVFLLTAVVGKVIMARTPDVGLAGVKTIDELSGRQSRAARGVRGRHAGFGGDRGPVYHHHLLRRVEI